MPRWASPLGLVLSLLLAPGALAEDPAKDVAEARKAELSYLVRQDCGSCHGMTLKGGLGKALLPDDLAHLDTESLTAIILDGIPGKPMPPWRNLIRENEARWIADALKQGWIK
ncbi:MAG: cytochrome c [Alphaproteobacteria bacterium]